MTTISIHEQSRGGERTNVSDLSLGFINLSNDFGDQFSKVISRSVRGIVLEQLNTADATEFYPLDWNLTQQEIEEFRVASATDDLSRYKTEVYRKAKLLVNAMASLWEKKIREKIDVWVKDNPEKPAKVTAYIEGADTSLRGTSLPIYVFVRDYKGGVPQIQVETSVKFTITEREVQK